MKYLLPHKFKKNGFAIGPLGFVLWVCMQKGVITQLLYFLLGSNTEYANNFALINTVVAYISFSSFILGFYFLIFSKEKVEDEMVASIRLECYQFAAMLQYFCIILGFLVVLIGNSPPKGYVLLYFVILIFLFWVTFIVRFNYILHHNVKHEK